MLKVDQTGVAHILLLVAAVGLVAFLVISSSASFKDNLFATLFPKPASFAASRPISAPIPTSKPPLRSTPTPTFTPGYTTPGYGTPSGR